MIAAMRAGRLILSIILIPLCVAVTKTVLTLLMLVGAAADLKQSLPILAIGIGIVLWIVIFYVLPRPLRMYVLAHELTHALWGAICGARVSGLRIAKAGGSVKISQVNWLTALAPYFFPFYTMLVILAYGLLALKVDMRRWELMWFGLIGLTLSFHWTFTLDALTQSQSDIRRYGRLFSYTQIYLLNLLGIGLLLVLTPPITLEIFMTHLMQDISLIWRWSSQAFALIYSAFL